MIVKIWGVRGSIPTPGRKYVRYGGNTSCVSIEIGNKVLIIDAGSGIKPLGDQLSKTDQELFLLFTHLHSDHLIGFTFFTPFYLKGRKVNVLNYQNGDLDWAPMTLFDGFHFPLKASDLGAQVHEEKSDPIGLLASNGFNVSTLPVNHPGGAFGFRIEHKGRSFVHIPDNELDPPGQTGHTVDHFVSFCQGADVLCHDAQYIASDMPFKWGWGHSQVQLACDLAIKAKVKHLMLFHHDPARTDVELDKIQERSRALLEPNGIKCTVAYEGMKLFLGGR